MRFSDEEINDLLKAWLAISFAFGFALSRGFKIADVSIFVLAALTVGVAFLLHELGHKFVAQRYGLWAEFRADNTMLIIAVLFALLPPHFVFAAPGAVIILGVTDIDTYGKTAVAGPIVNIILALIFFLILRVPLPASPISLKLTPLFAYGFAINSWLAFFNLIPFGPLDGTKVMNWSKYIWASLFVFSAILSFVI